MPHAAPLLAKQNVYCSLGGNALTLRFQKDLFQKASLLKTGILLFSPWVVEQNVDRSHTERHTKRIEFKAAWLLWSFYVEAGMKGPITQIRTCMPCDGLAADLTEHSLIYSSPL